MLIGNSVVRWGVREGGKAAGLCVRASGVSECARVVCVCVVQVLAALCVSAPAAQGAVFCFFGGGSCRFGRPHQRSHTGVTGAWCVRARRHTAAVQSRAGGRRRGGDLCVTGGRGACCQAPRRLPQQGSSAAQACMQLRTYTQRARVREHSGASRHTHYYRQRQCHKLPPKPLHLLLPPSPPPLPTPPLPSPRLRDRDRGRNRSMAVRGNCQGQSPLRGGMRAAVGHAHVRRASGPVLKESLHARVKTYWPAVPMVTW